MIKHVVLFKVKDYPPEEKRMVLNELKSLLEGLKEKIGEVLYLEVGLNYILEAKSFDIALITHFRNVEDLEKYKVHGEHQKVLEKILETTTERAAVDFEF